MDAPTEAFWERLTAHMDRNHAATETTLGGMDASLKQLLRDHVHYTPTVWDIASRVVAFFRLPVLPLPVVLRTLSVLGAFPPCSTFRPILVDVVVLSVGGAVAGKTLRNSLRHATPRVLTSCSYVD